MIRNRGLLPLDYSLCAMTVTVYHREGLTRQVLEGVHFEWTGEGSVSGGVHSAGTGFLLVVPYECVMAPGDRVVQGIGPEMDSWVDTTGLPTVGATAGLPGVSPGVRSKSSLAPSRV